MRPFNESWEVLTFVHFAVFTYRYFLHRFPELCILAVDAGKPIGCVVGKIDQEETIQNGQVTFVSTGYIGMLAVQSSYRRRGIGKALVRKVLQRMKNIGCQSVTLETGKYCPEANLLRSDEAETQSSHTYRRNFKRHGTKVVSKIFWFYSGGEVSTILSKLGGCL